jgi:ubiquinone/menaquinone biosynthesis C-methylase UbiE
MEMTPREARIEAWDRKYQGAHPRWRGPPEPGIHPPEGARVLELGCGDGKTLRGLVGARREVIGLDFSRAGLTSLRARSADNGEFQLVQADGSHLPFAPGSFGVVVAHHFFEHFEAMERREAAAEAVRVLSWKGALYLRAFSSKDMRAGKGSPIEPSTFMREGIPYHYFEEGEVQPLFRGLTIESIRTDTSEKRFAGEPRKRAVIVAVLRKSL